VVDISRRAVIQGTGVVGVTMLPIAAPAQEHGGHKQAPSPPPAAPNIHASQQQPIYLFFNADAAAFIEAAVARLIPEDDEWGGAFEAGVPNCIDKELAGA
jgi:gluconate 2-dehydrogenase gamma chain